MAQVIMCDACKGEVAVLLVSFPQEDLPTIGVGAECEEGFHMWRMEMLSLAREPSGEPEGAGEAPEAGEAPSAPEEAPEGSEEATEAPAGFPGTKNVVKSTHGHRAKAPDATPATS